MNTLDFSRMTGAMDLPDDRDIRASELMMAPLTDIPDEVTLDHTPYLNQGNIGACTLFGCAGAYFETIAQILNAIGEPYKQPFELWPVWDEAKKRGASDTGGWYIQSMLQLLTDLGLIGGYIRITDSGKADFDVMCSWIARKYAIVSGTADGNWPVVVNTGRYARGGTFGHCFQWNAYKRKNVKDNHSPNSWGGAGDFWSDFNQFGHTYFTQYVVIPTKDVELLKDVKDKRRQEALERARQAKLWNELRKDDIATDEEIGWIVDRALEVDGKRMSRKWYAQVFSDRIIQGKSVMEVWNKLRGWMTPTVKEKATMFTRAALRDPKSDTGRLTREQVAIICARDLLK